MYFYNYLSKIESKVSELLEKHNITSPAIPVKKIVTNLGLKLVSYDFGDESEISGMLVIENGIGTIGYNPKNSKQRQRFTIAHELGHFLLHNNSKSEVFVDKDFIVKYRSDKQYSPFEIKQEQEANAFAAELLMPKKMLLSELSKKDYKSMGEAEFIKTMAKIFEVSIPAMSFRVTNSNLYF